MADDAGALLVRSGLVPSSALDEARVKVASLGGTLGEQLVASGTISDDALTDFYRKRLLVPQVNPNTLARLPVRVVSAIPSDMAIELRAIPVSLDGDNNLTVAMSDPSDSHAVDEIAFFTGTYVVRAVATQMQIAWCLAHYYGHVTPLGQRLLQPTGATDDTPPTPSASGKIPRTKGHTAKVDAARHRAIVPVTGPVDLPRPNSAVLDDPSVPEPPPKPAEAAPEPAAEPPEPQTRESMPEIAADSAAPDRPRARSISGEIRVPIRRAPSIRPPMPDPLEDDDADGSGPVITIEAGSPDEDPTGPRKVPVKRRVVRTDPPELRARAGEVDAETGPITKVDLDEPRIIINDEPPTGADVSGELRVVAHRDELAAPATTIEVDDTSVGVVIHEHYKPDSEPVLLERRAGTDDTTGPRTPAPSADDDTDDDDVVVLDAPKHKPRPDKRTQMGMIATPILPRTHRDTEATGVPTLDDTDPRAVEPETDPTRVDATAAPSSPDDYSDETLAAPPSAGRRRDDTSPNVAPPGLARTSTRPLTPRPIRANSEDDGHGVTSVMSAVELDEAIPQRTAEVLPGHLEERANAYSGEISDSTERRVDYDPVDDGWGPPGSTIPPPLLGAMPGTEDDSGPARIPVSDVESTPLIVAPPSPPEPARGSPAIPDAPSLVRALEEATSRSVQLIHALERAQSRDDVITLMTTHLADTHRRAGFFSIKSTELTVFSMLPKPELIPVAALRLDRPSTLQDVVGTRLPYRGPMHDDDSRHFLAAALGTCPAEILLVPVTVRERVVGVLFGEHRLLHTFDDQLALAARAAGMALERILKTKRN